MPRVHYVKKARKDNPAVKTGESYYWWKFNFGPKMFSKTRPKRSQLTRSDFYATLWDLEDSMPDEMTEDDAENFCNELETLIEECQDRLDNMPQHLQDTSDSGIMLQERIDMLEEWISAIQNLDYENLSSEEVVEQINELNPGVS